METHYDYARPKPEEQPRDDWHVHELGFKRKRGGIQRSVAQYERVAGGVEEFCQRPGVNARTFLADVSPVAAYRAFRIEWIRRSSSVPAQWFFHRAA